MIILLDENVDNRLKPVIKSHGFAVNTTFEDNLSGKKDQRILEYALENEMIILTHDDDFISIASEINNHASIIYIPQNTGFRDMKNRIEKLEETKLDNKNEVYFL